MKNIHTQLGGTKMNHDDKLSGTLFSQIVMAAHVEELYKSPKKWKVSLLYLE